MRKLFSLFLALVATTSLWAHYFEVDGIYYNHLDGNNVEVTYRGNYYYSYDNEYAGEVIIPSTVTYYGTTYSVTSIGMDAFHGCSSLTSITIPNSVTSIGKYAFERCSSLTSITIPSSVTSIGDKAFYWCYDLTSIVVASGNSTYDSRDNCNAIIATATNTLIAGCQNTTIPNSVTSIGNYAFAECTSLTSVTIPNSVTSIGKYAFERCSSLTSITIPNSVTNIGGFAFYDCSSLTSVTIPNSVTSIGTWTFNRCSSLTSITIPNSVTSIGDGAFDGCSSLTSITIPNSVTSIGEEAFRSCTSLTSITIPNSVTSIGYMAFEYCTSLTSVTIPNSITSIGERAFEYCRSLTSITIPSSVKSIGDFAFLGCSSLTSITCEATTPPTLGSSSVFSGVSKSIPVYVPCGSKNAYKAASGWNDFTNIQDPFAEYSIQLYTSNSQMGSAIVVYNTSCGAKISATAKYGYHFVRWSDGVTDNIRTLVLTQDTVLTAEFAINQYTITTVSSDTQRGTTQGDTTVNYLEYITISATANYGYHFSHWNHYNYDNPRQVQVTNDMTYTATFDKNTYAISLSCNEGGRVEGVTSAEYLDTVTISAKPNFGYHFVQWSDGVTDNPRHFILTQDTTFSAEFAQTFSGQCGDNLYWNYNETVKTISITGSGEMYYYTATTQPWLLFKEELVEVTTTNTVTSIGTSAFEGCIRLGKVTLGSSVQNIAANAFAGCTRLYDIYVYATYPPFADESSFANYNVYVYIPCEYQRNYILDVVWGKFKFIECLESEETTTDGNVTVVPGTNDVTITWPTEDNADTYTIVIKKDGEVFCTLTFNAEGQLLNIAFAPGRAGNHPAQYAQQAGKGYRFTVTSLESGTKYGYNIDVKDASNKTIKSHSGEFTTQSTTAVDNITTNNANIQKIIRDGQFIIVRDGVEYNAVGQEM